MTCGWRRVVAGAAIGLASLAGASRARADACGFTIVAEPGTQQLPRAVADGLGGAYVAWVDGRSGVARVYLLRLAPDGQPAAGWPGSGTAVSQVPTGIDPPQLARDSEGGCYVAWDSGLGIHVQHFGSDGAVAHGWTADGVHVVDYAPTFSPHDPRIVADAAGGVFVTWSVDYYQCSIVRESAGATRTNCASRSFSRVARVNSAGAVAWTIDGQQSSTMAADHTHSELVSDGREGAIVLDWLDTSEPLVAKRVGLTGAIPPGWPRDVRVPRRLFGDARIEPNASGGAVIIWHDLVDHQLRVGQVDGNGSIVPGWGPSRDLVAVSGNSVAPRIVSDGVGGAVAAWRRLETPEAGVYALAIDPSGAIAESWPAGGVRLSDADGVHEAPTLVPDGAGGAFAAWTVDASGATGVRFQHVTAGGSLSPTFGSAGLLVCDRGAAPGLALVRIDSQRELIVWTDTDGPGTCCADIRGAIVQEDAAVVNLVASADAQLLADRVLLTWRFADAPGLTFAVERSASGLGPWDLVTIASPDASGRLLFEDPQAASLAPRTYRLRESNSASVVTGSMIEVRGTPTLLALSGPVHNPVVGEIVVRVELPPGAGRLQLFDLAGRELRRRDVLQSGPVSLGSARELPPGVYLVRLSAGASALTSRVCVVH